MCISSTVEQSPNVGVDAEMDSIIDPRVTARAVWGYYMCRRATEQVQLITNAFIEWESRPSESIKVRDLTFGEAPGRFSDHSTLKKVMNYAIAYGNYAKDESKWGSFVDWLVDHEELQEDEMPDEEAFFRRIDVTAHSLRSDRDKSNNFDKMQELYDAAIAPAVAAQPQEEAEPAAAAAQDEEDEEEDEEEEAEPAASGGDAKRAKMGALIAAVVNMYV